MGRRLPTIAAITGKPLALAGALSAPGISVIAEIKRRSPSAGTIGNDFDPVRIAKQYHEAGAAAISAAPQSADELKGRAEKVSYSDLNVDKEEGAQALYRRLQRASKRVCGVESFNNAGSDTDPIRQQVLDLITALR